MCIPLSFQGVEHGVSRVFGSGVMVLWCLPGCLHQKELKFFVS